MWGQDMSETTAPPTTNILAKVKQSGNDVTRRILELLVGAFTLVTALTWNDAVKSMFAKGGVFAFEFGRWGPWINAVFITLLVYFLTMWLKKYITSPCTNLCAQTVQGIAGGVASGVASGVEAARATQTPLPPAPMPCPRRPRRRFGPRPSVTMW
jgi:hypothetical protein